MKKLSKVLIVISVIVASMYGYYQYKLHQYYQIKPQDDKYLKEKVFAKDSENRGFSDKAKREIEEDLSPLFEKSSNNVVLVPENNSSEKLVPIYPTKIKRVYELIFIQERKNLLANSQKEYLDGFIRWRKLMKCLNILANNSVSFNNIYKTNHHPDGPRMNEMIEIIYQKYTKRLSFEEHVALTRVTTNEEECEAFSNE